MWDGINVTEIAVLGFFYILAFVCSEVLNIVHRMHCTHLCFFEKIINLSSLGGKWLLELSVEREQSSIKLNSSGELFED